MGALPTSHLPGYGMLSSEKPPRSAASCQPDGLGRRLLWVLVKALILVRERASHCPWIRLCRVRGSAQEERLHACMGYACA